MTQPVYESRSDIMIPQPSNNAYEATMLQGSNRSRSRCPIKTQGGSAIDRRRVQNRMAQRAYRQRKELAIDTLKQRVSELEKVNEDIGREYINFTDLVLQKNLMEDSPEMALRIKETTLKMLRVARDAGENDTGSSLMDDVTNQEPGAVNDQDDLTPPPVNAINREQEGQALSLDDTTDSTSRSSSNSRGLQASGTPGYNLTGQATHPPAVTLASDCTEFAFQDTNCALPIPDAQMEYHFASCGLPGVSYSSTLCPPRSYAAHELTFGRRFHRASQEAGFLLASMQSPPLLWFSKVFRFCLHFETKEQICSRLGDAVRRSRDMTLNNWRYPFTNLGGAGLFYPEMTNSTSFGNPSIGGLPVGNRSLPHEAYKPPDLTGFSTGPFSPEIEETRDLRLNAQMRMIEPELRGDFFDSDEIEICLRRYGVTIPANKDFVTAELNLKWLESDQEVGPFDDLADGDVPIQPNAEFVTMGPNMRHSTAPGNSQSGHCWMGMPSMAPLGSEYSDCTASARTMPPFSGSTGVGENWKRSRSKRTKVKIDVERLITSLVNSTICLGRTPAVRPKDIRRSLRQSVVVDE